jgi:hypothetical protein
MHLNSGAADLIGALMKGKILELNTPQRPPPASSLDWKKVYSRGELYQLNPNHTTQFLNCP